MNNLDLAALARRLGGRLLGPLDITVNGADTLDRAVSGQVSFIDDVRLIPKLEDTEASAVLAPESFPELPLPTIFVKNVRRSFAACVEIFRPRFQATRLGISPQASVHPTARLGKDVDVHPFAVIGPDVVIGDYSVIHSGVTLIGRCTIGQHCTIYPNSVLYEDTMVGDRCVLHAGSVIGAYGFGYETANGTHQRGDQLGHVRIEDDVEIGACSTIDRGTYGATVVAKGTKIDNQVMIAHNCQIGRHNLICSQVGVAGSSSTGDYVIMAGQVGVPDHVRIGDRAILGAKAGIMRDVPSDMTVLGIPATPERDQMARQAAFAKLPEMRKQFRAMQRELLELRQSLDRVEQQGPLRDEAA